MSYCRWSTDDYQCDLYVYGGGTGIVVSVAGYRRVFKDPLPPHVPLREDTINQFVERQQAMYKLIDDAELEPIGLSRDGETFCCASIADAVELLVSLREEGYRFPRDVINALIEEEEEAYERLLELRKTLKEDPDDIS